MSSAQPLGDNVKSIVAPVKNHQSADGVFLFLVDIHISHETSLSWATLRSLLTAEKTRKILHNLREQHDILQPESDVNDTVDGDSADVTEVAHHGHHYSETTSFTLDKPS